MSTRRERALRRLILSMSYLWVVTFDVVVSLADAGAEDATALATSISEELADDSLAASIEAAIGVAVQVVEDSIAVVQATSSPTRFPTRLDGGKQASSASSGMFIIAGAAVAVCLLLCIGVRYAIKARTKGSPEKEDPANENDLQYLFGSRRPSTPAYLRGGGQVQMSTFAASTRPNNTSTASPLNRGAYV